MSSLLDQYSGKRVVVTGGASFIGSFLTESLLRHGADVRVVDDLSSGLKENLAAVANDIDFIEGDLRNDRTVSAAMTGREICFHLAAMHGGRGYIETHPVECTNNMLLDHTVFAAAARNDVQKIVFASSACVYPTNLQAEEEQGLLLKESDAGFDEPGKAFADGEYGWAKLVGEMQLRAFHKQYGIEGIACRVFTAYGERENESHAVIALIAKAVAGLEPYPIWGNGRQTRNFTYVGDTVMGLMLSGLSLSGFNVINVGRDVHNTINEVVELIFEIRGRRPAEIKYELDKPVGVKSRAADNTRIERLLNWKPEVDLRTGLKRTVDWYESYVSSDILGDLQRRLMER